MRPDARAYYVHTNTCNNIRFKRVHPRCTGLAQKPNSGHTIPIVGARKSPVAITFLVFVKLIINDNFHQNQFS